MSTSTFKVELRGPRAPFEDVVQAVWREAAAFPGARAEKPEPQVIEKRPALGMTEVILTITVAPIVQVVVERAADWLVDWIKRRWPAKKGAAISVVFKVGESVCVLQTEGDESPQAVLKKVSALRDELNAAASVVTKSHSVASAEGPKA